MDPPVALMSLPFDGGGSSPNAVDFEFSESRGRRSEALNPTGRLAYPKLQSPYMQSSGVDMSRVANTNTSTRTYKVP